MDERFKIWEFDFWTLFMDKNQFPYLGSCYAYMNNNEERRVSEEKINELFKIVVGLWDKAIKELYHHDIKNVFLEHNGGIFAHLIPVYKSKFDKYGIVFEDNIGNSSHYPKVRINSDTLFVIRDELRGEFKKLSR